MNLGVCVSTSWIQEQTDIKGTATDAVLTLAAISVQPELKSRIRDADQGDEQHQRYRELARTNPASTFKENEDGLLYFNQRVCVLEQGGLRREILQEAHESGYTIHPGEVKMYRDLRTQFWWPNMKKDVSEFVARCITCQQVKAERRKIAGLLYPNSRAQMKFQIITMDFITGLPRTQKRYDSIWVIVDTLTKVAHFIPLRNPTSGGELAELFLQYQFKYHGVPETIISDRDT